MPTSQQANKPTSQNDTTHKRYSARLPHYLAAGTPGKPATAEYLDPGALANREPPALVGCHVSGGHEPNQDRSGAAGDGQPTQHGQSQPLHVQTPSTAAGKHRFYDPVSDFALALVLVLVPYHGHPEEYRHHPAQTPRPRQHRQGYPQIQKLPQLSTRNRGNRLTQTTLRTPCGSYSHLGPRTKNPRARQ